MENLLAAIDSVENGQALREKLTTQLHTSFDQKVSDKKIKLDAKLAKDTAKLNKLKADLDKQQQKVLASRGASF
jgi:acyl-coenzyme A thioesterase PaaI-like protein